MLPGFQIAAIPVFGDRILAPMDGISDLPYRSLCRRFGSALSYTPFVNALDILSSSDHGLRPLDFLPEERPVVFQIFDSSPERLLEAALRLMALGPDVLDVNMGCSVRSVASRGAGAALLREPSKVRRIIAELTRALPIPVTAKIRLGWDSHNLTYLQVARAVEDGGGSLIAVHARTREQGYGGLADWDAIAQLKASVTIPVIGNGDVTRPGEIARMRAHTGCEAVMIGRSAIGNPWIFQGRERSAIPPDEVYQVINEHLRSMLSYYGAEVGLLRFRKHLTRYLRPMTIPADIKTNLLTCEDAAALAAQLPSAILSASDSRVPMEGLRL